MFATKQSWIRMRRRLLDGRPVDDGGAAYARWYAGYVATDSLDPEPLRRVFTVAEGK